MYIQFYKTGDNLELPKKYYFEKKDYKFIGPISSLNIFIGPNNSGKSRFMRELMKMDEIYFSIERNIFKDSLILRASLKAFLKVLNQAQQKPLLQQYNQVAESEEDKNLMKGIKHDEFPRTLNSRFSFDESYFLAIDNTLNSFLMNCGNFEFVESFLEGMRVFLKEISFLLRGVEMQRVTGSQETGFRFRFYNLLFFSKEAYINLKKVQEDCINLSSNKYFSTKLKDKIYIPVLRSSHNLYNKDYEKIMDNLFDHTIEKNYCLDDQKLGIKIFSGLSLYDSVFHLHNNADEFNNRLQDFEHFLSETFFETKKVKIIPYVFSEKYNNTKYRDNTLLLIVDNIEREIHNWGDGLNSIIILMYILFTVDDNSWVFIEEPENSLHPAFQRVFIETIINHKILLKKKLKLFITTHSNHLLDLSMEDSNKTSLFIFNKIVKGSDEEFMVQNVSKNDLRILNILGINNSSIFLANCSIWVEGITDRKYLKVYLHSYMESDEFKKKNKKKYLEDIHYCFFEYAGSNLSHYIFTSGEIDALEDTFTNEKIKAKFLANRIFLLADRDKKKNKKHIKLFEQENVHFEYKMTPGLEVENLVSAVILKKILPDLSKKLTLNDINGKKIQDADYKLKGLGKYLQDLFKDKKIKFASKSGTLRDSYKQKLSNLVSEKTNWENMSKDAQKLIREIYNFIDKQNSKL